MLTVGMWKHRAIVYFRDRSRLSGKLDDDREGEDNKIPTSFPVVCMDKNGEDQTTWGSPGFDQGIWAKSFEGYLS